jgi:hypothetical protein
MKIRVAGSFLGCACLLLSSAIPVCEAYGQKPIAANVEAGNSVAKDTVQFHEAKYPAAKVPDQEWPRFHEMVTNVPRDWVSSAELTVSNQALPYVAGVGALTGLLIATDKQTDGFSKRITANSEAVRSTSRAFVQLGNGNTHLAVATGFALYGLLWDDVRAVRTGSQTVEALLACGVSVQVMKRISGRESPQMATGDRGVWHLFPNLRSYQRCQPRYYAFPSGHISTTMATVTVIAENYPELTWVRPIGYTLVGVLGVSLVNVGYHWYSDLPLGIALGYMFGMVAAHRGDGHFAFLGNDPYSGLQVLPTVTRERTGVTLALLL